MKIGIHNYYEVYNINNAIFNSDAYKIGENLEYPFVLLREKLSALGHSLDTLDRYDISEFDKILFLDYPNIKNINIPELYSQGKEMYLILFESNMLKPENFNFGNHKYFKKIFTWHDEYIDNVKYIKINYSFKIGQHFGTLKERNKLCTIIAGNKKHYDKKELYSERLKVVEWFEKYHPDDFDFYGFGWDKYFFVRPFSRLNRFSALTKILAKKYRTYKGMVDSKNEVLSKYKFSICYENAREIPGYITEKIFDCFFAGTVPIYWGAPNITKYIPKECFIDRRDFESIEDVYQFISKMGDVEYEKYIEAIKSYLKSDEIKQFSAENFVNTIIKECL